MEIPDFGNNNKGGDDDGAAGNRKGGREGEGGSGLRRPGRSRETRTERKKFKKIENITKNWDRAKARARAERAGGGECASRVSEEALDSFKE